MLNFKEINFFAEEIIKGQRKEVDPSSIIDHSKLYLYNFDKKGNPTGLYITHILTLMTLYTRQCMITLETGKQILEFEYYIRIWCSLEVYLFYHLIKGDYLHLLTSC